MTEEKQLNAMVVDAAKEGEPTLTVRTRPFGDDHDDRRGVTLSRAANVSVRGVV